MGFSGRCEVIKAPTTENDTVRLARVSIDGPQAMKISARVRPLRRARIGLAAASATHSAHSDQANHAAVRRLIPPTPRPCCLALPSQPHSTGLSSPKRYDKRYEEEVFARCEVCDNSRRSFATTSQPRWSLFLPMYPIPHVLDELPDGQLAMR